MIRAAIYEDNSFGKEITSFSVFEVRSNMSTKVIGAPIETGQVIFDNKVIDPFTVSVTGCVDLMDGNAASTMKKIEAFRTRRKADFLSVSDGLNGYKNLVLETYSASRAPQKYDLLYVTLVYKQAINVDEYSTKNIQNDAYSAVVDLGYQGGL